jgi:hypothetical protein
VLLAVLRLPAVASDLLLTLNWCVPVAHTALVGVSRDLHGKMWVSSGSTSITSNQFRTA